MAQGKMSSAQKRRISKGIEEPPKPQKQSIKATAAALIRHGHINGEHKKLAEVTMKTAKDQIIRDLHKDQQLVAATVRDMAVKAAPKVFNRMLALANGDGEGVPAAVQLAAQKHVLELAGISSATAAQQAKPVSEMSNAELADFIRASRSVLERHAKELEGATIDGERVV